MPATSSKAAMWNGVRAMPRSDKIAAVSNSAMPSDRMTRSARNFSVARQQGPPAGRRRNSAAIPAVAGDDLQTRLEIEVDADRDGVDRVGSRDSSLDQRQRQPLPPAAQQRPAAVAD
jgi:hypothetical protein